MKENNITEYHCCNDCNNKIDIPGPKPCTWEVGCLHPKGKPHPHGGLSRCDYYQEGD